jgi:hypothetical protein
LLSIEVRARYVPTDRTYPDESRSAGYITKTRIIHCAVGTTRRNHTYSSVVAWFFARYPDVLITRRAFR